MIDVAIHRNVIDFSYLHTYLVWVDQLDRFLSTDLTRTHLGEGTCKCCLWCDSDQLGTKFSHVLSGIVEVSSAVFERIYPAGALQHSVCVREGNPLGRSALRGVFATEFIGNHPRAQK